MSFSRMVLMAITGAATALLFFPSSVFAADTCSEAEILEATTPASPSPEARAWFFRVNKETVRIRSDLLLIGDSWAGFWPADKLSPFEVVKFGMGLATTAHVLWMLSSPELPKLRPRKVLIIVGTNNLTSQKACAVIAGIRRVIARSSEVWPAAQIAFLEIPPRGPDLKFKDEDRRKINADIQTITTIKTINADDKIACGWQIPCGNYREDSVHFTDAGYLILAKLVRESLFSK